MRSKNEVLCAAAGRLAAERSEADKPAKAHKTIFAPNNIYYFFLKPRFHETGEYPRRPGQGADEQQLNGIVFCFYSR
jgi:hypothetical protein